MRHIFTNVHRAIAVSLFVIIITSLCPNASAASTMPEPDFAFPKTVLADAEKQMALAERDGNEQAMISALLKILRANQLIDPHNTSAIENIERARQMSTQISDPALCGVMYALRAYVTNQAYQKDAYKYNRRTTPLTPVPADMTEWNGKQWQSRISMLCDSAMSFNRALQAQPINKYLDIVEIDKEWISFYPTLLDFVTQVVTIIAPEKTSSDKYYRTAIDASPNGSAPWMMWKCKMTHDNESLFTLAKENLDNPNCSVVLLNINSRNFDQQKEFYSLASDFLSRNADCPGRKALQDKLKKIANPSVDISYSSVCNTAEPLEISVNSTNCRRFTLNIYPYKDEYAKSAVDVRRLKPYTSVSVDFNDLVPFKADTVVSIPLKNCGRYFVTVLSNETDYSPSRVYANNAVRVINSLPLSFNKGPEFVIVAANPANGEPRPGAVVTVSNNKNSAVTSATTNADGMATMNLKDFNYRTTTSIRYNGITDTFDNLESNTNDYSEVSEQLSANILTDRALYHRGDSIGFVAVVSRIVSGKKTAVNVAEGTEINIILRNTNDQTTDSIKGTTDRFGRFSGYLKSASDGLSGRYTIMAETLRDKDISTNFLGSTSVTVSDYKLPTFEVKIDDERRDYPTAGCVTLGGKATTFSGQPVADADVKMDISAGYRYYFNPTGDPYFLETRTSADGTFSLTVCRDSLPENLRDSWVYQTEITVTSAAGESQQEHRTIRFGKPYNININAHDNFDTSKSVNLDVTLLDANGNTVSSPMEWSLTLRTKNDTEQKPSAQGIYSDKLNLKDVTPGIYRFAVWTADTALADTVRTDITLYNPNIPIIPGDEDIFLPVSKIDRLMGQKDAEILIGSKNDNSTLYYAAPSSANKPDVRLVRLHKGWNRVKIDLSSADPDSEDIMPLMSVNHNTVSQTWLMIDKSKRKDLIIKPKETFRDKLVPGATETWRLSVTDAEGHPVQSALVLDMYNRALDMLTGHALNIRRPSSGFSFSVFPAYPQFYNSTQYFSHSLKDLAGFSIIPPNFKYIEQGYFLQYALKSSSNRMLSPKMASMKESAAYYAADASYETMEEEEAEVSFDTVTVAGAANDDGMIKEDVEDTDAKSMADKNIQFRSAEVPLALWCPTLTTDADGNSEISFTVPNAIASWRLLALAWTGDLTTGSIEHDFVSNKPIMVQPNMPRFIRTGDSATVLSTVYNNTDAPADIEVKMEIFNPLTDAIKSIRISTVHVEANASAVVSKTLDADSSSPAIGVRVYASAAGYSDGEQNVIAVLPNSQMIVETERFYLNPGEKTYSAVLPKGKDAKITLEFTENPVWTVVTALPGLITGADNTACGQSASLFSAAVAKGLVAGKPEIRSALDIWMQNPETSALISALEKNADLKIAALNATPWVQAAESQNERMARLCLLLDDKATAKTIADNIENLAKLQDKSGGWRWGEWCKEPSQFITLLVLERLGILKKLGFLPSGKQTESMIRSALSYVDSNVSDIDSRYTIVRSILFKNYRNTANGTKVINATVNAMAKDWKNYSPSAKAVTAQVMWSANRRTLAREIMRSVAEFAVDSPDRGVEFSADPSVNAAANVLRAYAEIEPSNKLVDGIRQNLVVRRQSQSWGSSILTTDAVASILLSGSKWTSLQPDTKIHVDSVLIKPTALEAVTGHLLADVSAYGGDSLRITHNGNGPSYGSIYSQTHQTMTDVKAAGAPDLSIEKALTVKRGSTWEAVSQSSPLKVGDKVRVTLTIHNRGNRLDYVAIVDERPAAFEPVQQLPGWLYSEGVGFYRENNDATTCLYIDYMPRGTYILTYDMYVNNAGTYSSGVATLQSQYSPAHTAHSAGSVLIIEE